MSCRKKTEYKKYNFSNSRSRNKNIELGVKTLFSGQTIAN